MAFLGFDDGIAPQNVANLLLYSEQFDNAAWTKDTGVTVTPNAVEAPDGTTTADAIVYDGTGSAGHYRIFQSVAAPTTGNPFTASIWLRADTTVALQLANNFATTSITVTTTWQRFSVSGTATGAVGQLLLYSPTGVNTAFTVYAWGAQTELTTYASVYFPTEAVAVGGFSVHNDYLATPAARFAGWTPKTLPYGDSVNRLSDHAIVMFSEGTDYGASFTLENIPVRALTDNVNRLSFADRLIAHLVAGGTVLVQTDDRNAAIYKACGLWPGSSPTLQLTDKANLLYSLSLQLVNRAAARMGCVYA